MKPRPFLLLITLCLLTSVGTAADVAGKWKAIFDTQIGQQVYTYEFATTDGKLTGLAHYRNDFNSGTVALKNLQLKGDQISFREELDFDGMLVVITYTGTVDGDTIKFARRVGDIATEHLEAHRQPAASADE